MAEQFWHLTWPLECSAEVEWTKEMTSVPVGLCPLNPTHMSWKRTNPLRIEIPRKRVYEFQWGAPGECIITDSVLTTFHDEGISGFEVQPVEAKRRVRTKSPDPAREDLGDYPGHISPKVAAGLPPIPRLWELTVKGWGGFLPEDTGVRVTDFCRGCGGLTYSKWHAGRFRVDESQWDGSDIFMVWPIPLYILISDRLAQLIRSMRWEGARLNRVQEIPGADSISDSLAPGPLTWYMADHLARQRGESRGLYVPFPAVKDRNFLEAWHNRRLRMNKLCLREFRAGRCASETPTDEDYRKAFAEFRVEWSRNHGDREPI